MAQHVESPVAVSAVRQTSPEAAVPMKELVLAVRLGPHEMSRLPAFEGSAAHELARFSGILLGLMGHSPVATCIALTE